MKFRKKPVVIEAYQFDGTRESIPEWIRERAGYAWFGGNAIDPPAVYIRTLEGEMRADAGDWLIIGVKGELYPCKPDIFEQTYERSNDANSAIDPVVGAQHSASTRD